MPITYTTTNLQIIWKISERQDYQQYQLTTAEQNDAAALDVPRSLFAPRRTPKARRTQKAVRDCQAPEKICGDAKRRPETQILKAIRLRTFATESPVKISVRSRFARTQLFFLFIRPTDPTFRVEGDGKRNILLGWPNCLFVWTWWNICSNNCLFVCLFHIDRIHYLITVCSFYRGGIDDLKRSHHEFGKLHKLIQKLRHFFSLLRDVLNWLFLPFTRSLLSALAKCFTMRKNISYYIQEREILWLALCIL